MTCHFITDIIMNFFKWYIEFAASVFESSIFIKTFEKSFVFGWLSIMRIYF